MDDLGVIEGGSNILHDKFKILKFKTIDKISCREMWSLEKTLILDGFNNFFSFAYFKIIIRLMFIYYSANFDKSETIVRPLVYLRAAEIIFIEVFIDSLRDVLIIENSKDIGRGFYFRLSHTFRLLNISTSIIFIIFLLLNCIFCVIQPRSQNYISSIFMYILFCMPVNLFLGNLNAYCLSMGEIRRLGMINFIANTIITFIWIFLLFLVKESSNLPLSLTIISSLIFGISFCYLWYTSLGKDAKMSRLSLKKNIGYYLKEALSNYLVRVVDNKVFIIFAFTLIMIGERSKANLIVNQLVVFRCFQDALRAFSKSPLTITCKFIGRGEAIVARSIFILSIIYLLTIGFIIGVFMISLIYMLDGHLLGINHIEFYRTNPLTIGICFLAFSARNYLTNVSKILNIRMLIISIISLLEIFYVFIVLAKLKTEREIYFEGAFWIFSIVLFSTTVLISLFVTAINWNNIIQIDMQRYRVCFEEKILGTF